ncbi:MAG: thermonuclease family protein [Salinibacter sp.]
MPTLAGQVVRVKDGDTVVVQFEDSGSQTRGARETVRLGGIDAPEKGQPYGPAATRAMQKLAGGKAVTVDVQTRGPYGRLIGRVQTPRYDVGRSMVHNGYAWADRKNGHTRRLLALENRARQEEKGLWARDRPTAPWRWRSTAGQRKRSNLASGLLWIVGTAMATVLLFAVLVALAAA